jgi:hypothetical protein
MSNRALPSIEYRQLAAEHLPDSQRVWWLFPGLVVGLTVAGTYLATHPYPAFGGGLYLEMAERILGHGYALPERIPKYMADGVPFAYPPLGFYVVAVLQDLTGLGPFAVTRYLPVLYCLLYLVPFFFFADSLLGSSRQAGLATVLAATSPYLLQWHISAGGIVRALATVVVVTGLYTGLQLFRTGGVRWLLSSTVLFALLVLTHPVYTLFFVVSYLWLWTYFDRSLLGFLRGAIVGVGGVVVTAPWWGLVVSRHGLDVFLGTTGTHGGIGTQLLELLSVSGPAVVLFRVAPWLFDFTSPGMMIAGCWLLVAIVSALWLAFRGEYFVLVWLVLAAVIVSKPRFVNLTGALALPAFLFGAVVPRLASRTPTDYRRYLPTVSVVLVILAAASVGVAYTSSNLDSHAGSQSLPQFLDDDHVDAMRWAERNTAPGAGFVVLGDTGEWFPLLANRTLLLGPWGVEWHGEDRYNRQLSLFNHLSTCSTPACLTGYLGEFRTDPDYLYVPRGSYTVRGMEQFAHAGLHAELTRSPVYDLVYQNDGVRIYSIHTPKDAARDSAPS